MISSRLPFPEKVGPDDFVRFLLTWAVILMAYEDDF